jgi:uncharacterized membrane protein
VVLAVACIYVVLMVRAQHNKLESFAMGFDLALYEQVIWNTAHGRFFLSSALGDTSVHLGRDVILVELFLALPYAVFPSTYTLLVLQTVVLAAGAGVVYVLGRKHLGGNAGLLLAVVYLAYLPLQFLNLYEFQPRAFAIAPTLLAIHYLEEQRLFPFVLSLLAMLSTRTDVALAVIMLGFLALLHRRPRPFAFWSLGLGLAWFAVVIGLVVPHFNPQGEFLYFQWFKPASADSGQDFSAPADLVQTLLTPTKGRFLAAVYGPLAFLPLLRPDLLLVSLPALGMAALSTAPMLSDIRYQYAALLYPVAFAAAIYLMKGLPAHRLGLSMRALRRGLLLAICAATVLSYVFRLSPLLQWNRATPPTNRSRAVRWVVARIPRTAAVAATSCVAPFLARRERLFHFPPRPFALGFYATDLSKVDYIVADRRCGDERPLAELEENPDFVREVERSSVVLYRRRGMGDLGP